MIEHCDKCLKYFEKLPIKEICQKGLDFETNENFNKALECYDKGIEYVNQKLQILFIRKNCLDYLKDKNVSTFTNNFPDEIFLYNKGKILFMLESYLEAINCFDDAIKINRDNLDNMSMRGYCCVKLNKFKEAVQYFKKAYDLDEKKEKINVWFNLGYSYYMLERYQSAMELFKEVITKDPLVWTAHMYMGVCFHKLDQIPEAKHSFNLALDLNYKSAHLYIYYADFLYDQDKYEEALAYYENAIYQDPYNYDIYVKKVDCLINLGDVDDVQEYFSICINLNLNKSLINKLEANIYKGFEKYILALDIYNKLIKSEPNNFEISKNIAECYIAIKEYYKAIGYYNKCIKLNPNDLSLYKNKVHCIKIKYGIYNAMEYYFFTIRTVYYFKLRKEQLFNGKFTKSLEQAYIDSIEFFNDCLELDYDNSIIHYYLGTCYGHIGRLDEAIEYLDKVFIAQKDNQIKEPYYKDALRNRCYYKVENDNKKRLSSSQKLNDEILPLKKIEVVGYKPKLNITGEPIGNGKFARVYIGTLHEYQVAVKHIIKFLPKDKFKREAEIMNDIYHPNVMKLIAWGYDIKKSEYYIITDYIDGGSLSERLKSDQKLSKNDKLSIIKQIASTMNYLHSLPQPVFHRDLKGENILINNNNDIFISDFGLSKKIAEEDLNKSLAPTAYCGTIRYNAPEILDDNVKAKTSFKTDVYSFGIVIWEILSEKKPYEEYTDDLNVQTNLRNKVVKGERPNINHVKGYSKEIVELMQRCWEQNPKDRPFFEEICEILEKINI